MARQEALTSYAAERARLLLKCFRTGEANDPQTFVAAVTLILSRYPESVITSVTHPESGLPIKNNWIPTLKEVKDACEEAFLPIRQNEARLKRIREQMEMRARMDNGEKPTLAQLKEKYGENFGLTPNEPKPKGDEFKAPSWQAIASIYSADPSRIARLLKSDLA